MLSNEEIKNLIASKIAGQGSAVDVGGALPTILNAIVDMVADVPTIFNLPEGVTEVEEYDEQCVAIKSADFGYMLRIDSALLNSTIAGAAYAALSNAGIEEPVAKAAFGTITANDEGLVDYELLIVGDADNGKTLILHIES